MKTDQFRKKLIDSLIGNVITLGLSLVFPYAVITLYGTEILGEYTYNLSIITVLIFVVSLGLNNGLMYFIPRSGNRYVASTFLINLGMSILLILGTFLLFDDPYMKVMLPLLWFLSAETLFRSLFQSKHHIKEFFYVNLIGNQGVKLLIAFLIAIVIGPTFENLIIATYVGSIVSMIIYYVLTRKMFEGVCFSWEIIKYSLPLTISSVLYLAMMNVDRIMIGNILTINDVAIYSVITAIAMFPSLFLSILNTVFPPVISSMYYEGKIKELKQFYLSSVKMLTLISSFTIILIIVLRKAILHMYGAEYLEGQLALVFISIGQLVNAGVGSVWYIIMMTGHSKWNMYGEITTFFINISLNFILIPIYGINGAAFATMVSTSFSNILGFFLVRGIFKQALLEPKKTLVEEPIISSATDVQA